MVAHKPGAITLTHAQRALIRGCTNDATISRLRTIELRAVNLFSSAECQTRFVTTKDHVSSTSIGAKIDVNSPSEVIRRVQARLRT